MNGRTGDLAGGQLNNMSPINNLASLSSKNSQMKQNWGKYDDLDDGSSRGMKSHLKIHRLNIYFSGITRVSFTFLTVCINM